IALSRQDAEEIAMEWSRAALGGLGLVPFAGGLRRERTQRTLRLSGLGWPVEAVTLSFGAHDPLCVGAQGRTTSTHSSVLLLGRRERLAERDRAELVAPDSPADELLPPSGRIEEPSFRSLRDWDWEGPLVCADLDEDRRLGPGEEHSLFLRRLDEGPARPP